MKKSLLIITVFITTFCFAQTTKFEKPRYLKFATLLCPIDISKSYTEKGLLLENTATICISKSKTIAFENKIGEDDKEVKVKKVLIDTILVKTILIQKGYAFDVVQEIGSFSIIKFWDLKTSTGKSLIEKFKEKTDKTKDTKFSKLKLDKDYNSLEFNGLTATDNVDNFDLTETYYILPTKTLLNNSKEFEDKSNVWNIGLLVMPIKIRPFATESGQFDFSDGVSVGTTLSWTLHHNFKTDFTHNLLLYVGVSSYTADENKIKEQREDYKIATFSPAIGWMWEKNGVQLSLLTGIDFPSGNLQKNWVYRNMPWFGMGIGVGLFKINNENKTENPKQ